MSTKTLKLSSFTHMLLSRDVVIDQQHRSVACEFRSKKNTVDMHFRGVLRTLVEEFLSLFFAFAVHRFNNHKGRRACNAMCCPTLLRVGIKSPSTEDSTVLSTVALFPTLADGLHLAIISLLFVVLFTFFFLVPNFFTLWTQPDPGSESRSIA